MGAAGTPIRLVQESGRRIELMATDIQITTTRKVGQMAVGNTGSKRFGMDRNKNNCAIVVSGIITDDKEVTPTVGPKASIDFTDPTGYFDAGYELFNSVSVTDSFTSAGISEKWDDAYISLQDANDVFYYIRLDDGSHTGSSSASSYALETVGGTQDVIVIKMRTITGYGLGDTAGAVEDPTWKTNFVATLAAVINDGSLTLSNGFTSNTTMGANWTATTIKAMNNSSKYWALEITADSTDEIRVHSPDMMNNSSKPDINGLTNTKPSQKYRPTTKNFNNKNVNVMSGTRSAGDKVQDLVGILNNSDNMGMMGQLRRLGSSIKFVMEWLFSEDHHAADTNVGVARDYIMAIEIPFKSFVNATSGQESDVRVFHMPTGNTISPQEKGAGAAKRPGDSAGDTGTNWFGGKKGDVDQNIGIDGAVQSFDVNYAGGETVYSFTLTFLPIDWLF